MSHRHVVSALLAALPFLLLACDDGDPLNTGPGPASMERVEGGDEATGVFADAAVIELLEVVVYDAAGAPLEGVEVTWTVTSGGGVITPESPVTDAQGTARASWVLGKLGEPNTARAEVDGLEPIEFIAAETGIVEPWPPFDCEPAGTFAPGDTIAGALGDGDGDCGHDGWTLESWHLEIEESGTYELALLDAAFEGMIFVAGLMPPIDTGGIGEEPGEPGGGGGWTGGGYGRDENGAGTTSILRVWMDAGTWQVWVTSAFAEQGGAYRLTAQAWTPTPCVPQTTSLAVGTTVSGSLTDDDCTPEFGGYADVWPLHLDAETSVDLTLASDAFDAWIFVTDADGNWWAANDDGGFSLDARVRATLPAGDWLVWATSWWWDATGAYTLSVEAYVPCVPAETPIALGDTLAGELAEGDCADWGPYVDAWRLELAFDTTVEVSMSSETFFPMLTLGDDAGVGYGWGWPDNREGDTTGVMTATLVTTLYAGSYRIDASSWGAGEAGPYSLSIVPALPPPPPDSTVIDTTGAGG